MSSTKTGRPRKVPTEDMTAIVTRYFVEMSDTSSSLATHGIYRRLSDYAQSLGYNLAPHDFSRNKAVVAHIKSLDATISNTVTDSLIVPNFEPLDIPTLMNCSKKRIEESIRSRDQYFERLHQKAARAIEHHLVLAKKVEHMQAALQAANDKNNALTAENAVLKKELHAAESDVAYLTRIIRRDIEPERAHQFFQSLTSKEVIETFARNTITHSLTDLTREDRKARSEAERDVDSLNLLKNTTFFYRKH